MDIIMQDDHAASFPISQHGAGTRSWISFLTLSAFVDNQNEKIKADDEEAEQYIMLTMEEPEAHLHPQAQRQLFSQISSFSGQKIISTHSPSIVAQSALADAIHFSKRNGKTSAVRYKADRTASNEIEKIVREVINTRADILFASAVVLCEGITEELSLPIYFYEYFGCAPFSLGVSIINVGGKGNYPPYLSLMKEFDISWFIFSDGEDEAIKAVDSAVKTVFNVDYSSLGNVVILDNGEEYETYLIREGYDAPIIEAICEYEGVDNYLDSYISRMQGEKRKKGIIRDYNVPSGRTDPLTDLCLEHKTDYALPVSRKIVTQPDKDKRIPSKIETLFSSMAERLGYKKIAGEVKEK
jgi:putative ATP-dependent endonuclease of OLD family